MLFSLATLLIAMPAVPAWAWGRLGHRVIARLAEPHISPAAKAAIAGPHVVHRSARRAR
jgi:hypothetical protein